MKRKFAFILSLAAAAAVFTGCGKKSSDGDSESVTETQTAAASTIQPDPLATENKTTTATAAESTAAVTTTAAVQTTASPETPSGKQVDPLGGGTVKPNKEGGMLIQNAGSQDDRVLMTAAQSIFDSACHTEWEFRFGCPYEMDTSQYIENEFSWRYSLVTDPAIHSVQDVINDYCKVFSSSLAVDLSTEYIEKDGAVYALAPARGANIDYSASRISAVKSKSDNEIVLEVTNFFIDRSDGENKQYTQTDEFSIVLDPDGVWRAGKFTLPY